MNILISGGTGFIGTALCSHLIEQQHRLVVVTRRPESVRSPIRAIQSLEALLPEETFDIAINLAGEPIAGKRWSDHQKRVIRDSRLDITEEFIAYFGRTNQKPAVFISGSAVGYYGTGSTDAPIDETCAGDDSFSSQLCEEWEACALQAHDMGIRTCLLRTGIVLGRDGGALSKMLPPFKLGLGGRMGTGKQWMPWIALHDLIGIIDHCIADDSLQGPVNCTAPNPVTNRTFSAALGKALGRPAVIPMPAAAVTLLMGEMGQELLLSGKKVLPVKMQSVGFQFTYEHIGSALDSALVR